MVSVLINIIGIYLCKEGHWTICIFYSANIPLLICRISSSSSESQSFSAFCPIKIFHVSRIHTCAVVYLRARVSFWVSHLAYNCSAPGHPLLEFCLPCWRLVWNITTYRNPNQHIPSQGWFFPEHFGCVIVNQIDLVR